MHCKNSRAQNVLYYLQVTGIWSQLRAWIPTIKRFHIWGKVPRHICTFQHWVRENNLESKYDTEGKSTDLSVHQQVVKKVIMMFTSLLHHWKQQLCEGM